MMSLFKRLLSVLASLLLPCFVSAQGDPFIHSDKCRNDIIGLSIGTHRGFLNDENYSPLNYRENGILLAMFYEHISKDGKRLFMTRVDFTSGKLTTDASDYFTTDRLEGNIEASMLFRINPTSQRRFTFSVGPQLNLYAYYMQWRDEMDSWNYLMVQGLNAKGLVTYQATSRNVFRSSISIPLIGNLVRPPYNGFDQFMVEDREDVVRLSFRGEFASPADYFAIDWRTGYQYAFTDHLSVQVEYLFRYQKVSGTNMLRHFQNQFGGGLILKF